MELDTGASISIIAEAAFRQRYFQLKLEPSDVMLKSYCGKHTAVRRKVVVPVCFGMREATLPLLVAPDKCRTLLGRDWISALDLDFSDIRSVDSSCNFGEILREHEDAFSEGLGNLKGLKAKLILKEGATPKFLKPCAVPFELQDKVSEELQIMQKEGVMTLGRTSRWAAPIVPVLKQDDRARICSDFRVTINPNTVQEK